MTHFVHIHSSSRYDRSVELLEKVARRYNAAADLVTYTEVEFEQRERAVRRAGGKAFGFVAGDEGHANDSAIAYRKERFKLLHSEQFKASDLRIFASNGKMRDPVYATIAVLQDRENDRKVVVAVIHLASSVEGELFSKDRTRRTLQWLDAFRNTKRRINRLRKKYKADGMFVADYNVNFKKAWVRALIKSLAPAYRSGWVNWDVPGGTHGRRIIDATLTRGRIAVKRTARLFADDGSSDHRPYIEILRWT